MLSTALHLTAFSSECFLSGHTILKVFLQFLCLCESSLKDNQWFQVFDVFLPIFENRTILFFLLIACIKNQSFFLVCFSISETYFNLFSSSSVGNFDKSGDIEPSDDLWSISCLSFQSVMFFITN